MEQSLATIYLITIALLCLGLFRNSVDAKPITTTKASSEIDYLTKYGYLNRKDPGNGKLMNQADMAQSLRSLQRFAGLNETGLLDAATIRLMAQPRCGMPDLSPADKARRRRRYVLQGTLWKKKRITYRIKTFTNDLGEAEQKRIFKWAFDQWSKASKLDVTEAPNYVTDDKVDILINFASGSHGDGYPFDGQGGTLAHAFYPHNNDGIAGDAHFDDDETFSTGTRKGVNLDWVALHEFGHSLGLDHSTVGGSVMYPWYQGFKKNIQLTPDDLMGIQALYEKPVGGKEPTDKPFTRPKRPTNKPIIDECEVKKFDAWVYSKPERKTYAFIGDYYFIVDPHTVGVIRGPLKIVDKWTKVKTPISAAYARKDGRIVFFHEGTYWKYYGGYREQGPRPIKDYGLPKELEKMNGAFVWGRNTRTYFWKGTQYWRYNEKYRRMDPGYPRDISIWKKIPAEIDTVMKWKNGKTYFFKGTQYYKLDDYSLQSEAGYPKSIALKWMRCDQSSIEVVKTTIPPTIMNNTFNATISSVEGSVGDPSVGNAVLPSIVMLLIGALIAGKLM